MKTILAGCVFAGTLAMVLALGAPVPVAGAWEGRIGAARAITLKVRDNGRSIEGAAVFYIVKDEGSGAHTGSASPEIPFSNPRWNGEVLTFEIHGPHGEEGTFEMKATGRTTGEIWRVPADGETGTVLHLDRLR